MWTPQQFEAVRGDYPAPRNARSHQKCHNLDCPTIHYCVGQALMASQGEFRPFPAPVTLSDFLYRQVPNYKHKEGDAWLVAINITTLNDSEDFGAAWETARRFLTGLD